MKKVVITRGVPDQELAPLYEKYKVEVNPMDRDYTHEELMNAVKDADAVLCMLSNAITQEVLENAPNAQIFANYAVGYNNIDVDAAKRRNIFVTNTPDVLTDATADITWTLILSTARRVVEADEFTREGHFHGWAPQMYIGKDLKGRTLAVLGAGRIGYAVAQRAQGFGMKVIYHNRKPNAEMDKLGARYCDFETLLKKADVLSLHTPLTPETRHIMDAEAFKKMKPGAILINTARGPVVDERALAEALKNGVIWGAGLDVYEEEPKIYPELLGMKNVVLLPHIGSATEETRHAMVRIAVANITAVLEGKEPITSVY